MLAPARPSEQLPLIGWRLPSAASSQAPSSGAAFTPKHPIKTDQRRKVSSEHSESPRVVAEPPLLGLGFFSILIVNTL